METKEIELAEEIKRHDELYWKKNEPIISDEKYDELVEELKSINPNHSAINNIPDYNCFGESIKHETPMLSMGKCYSLEDMKKWASGTKSLDFVASPKFDGTALSVVYKDGKIFSAATRGNGEVGEDVTANAKQIGDIPYGISLLGRVEVRGEVFMPESMFQKLKATTHKDSKNARNLCAGSLKQKDPDVTGERGLLFKAYGVIGSGAKTEQEKFKFLRKNKFQHVEARYCKVDGFEDMYQYYLDKRDDSDFEIDGVIFTVNDVALHSKLGCTGHHPRYAHAWKIAGESATTTLLDIHYSTSRTGVVTPVAIMKPVDLSGAMVGKASLHNIGFIKSMALTKGAIIEVSRRGMVIPQVERVVKHGTTPFEIPTEVDGNAVVEDGDFLRLVNLDDSAEVAVGKLRHYVKALDIDGFGEKILRQMYDANLAKTPLGLYTLEAQRMVDRMDRMGMANAKKLIAQVDSHKIVNFADFLRSLGIHALGNTMSKTLAKKYPNLGKVLTLTASDLEAIDGVGDTTAESVVDGLKDNMELIQDLLTAGIEIIYPTDKKTVSGKLSGKSFVFTGALTQIKRKEAQALVEANGGDAPSSVRKGLSYLVNGDDDNTSGKCVKAQKLGVEIISENEFMEMVK